MLCPLWARIRWCVADPLLPIYSKKSLVPRKIAYGRQASESGTMLSVIRLTVSSLALCVATSVGAQSNLDKGKTGDQLYASTCAGCHKSPQSVTKTTVAFGLESFLREHYAANPESAATLAAYLKGLEKQSAGSTRGSGAKRTTRQMKPQSKPSESKEDDSGLDTLKRTFNSSVDTVQRSLDRLLQAIKPEKN
jgi:hypothetical protein